MASGSARATASPTDAPSRPSTIAGTAPSARSDGAFSALLVVATTWCPCATSCGTRRRPMAPVAPATKTLMFILLVGVDRSLRTPGRDRCPSCDSGSGPTRVIGRSIQFGRAALVCWHGWVGSKVVAVGPDGGDRLPLRRYGVLRRGSRGADAADGRELQG